jgi:hypothetical protein
VVLAVVVVEQLGHMGNVDPGAHTQSAGPPDAVCVTITDTAPSAPTLDTAENTNPVRATLPLYCSVLGCPVPLTDGRSALKQSPESPLYPCARIRKKSKRRK